MRHHARKIRNRTALRLNKPTKMVKAGKFCQAMRVLSSGQLAMYGASSVQAMLCEMPGSKNTGMGNRPSNWRKTICWRASVAIDCSSRFAAARESRCSRKPYTPDSPKRVSFWQKSTKSRTVSKG